MKYLKKSEKSRKRLDALFFKLEGKAIIVEGKRDADALGRIGFSAYAAAGKVRGIAGRIGGKNAVVLTDLDRSGEELALMLKDELEPYVKCDLETRKRLGAILELRNFEDIAWKLEKFNDVENGIFNRQRTECRSLEDYMEKR